MESSRVFVRGLPPTLDEAGFRKHFQFSSGTITDVKLMSSRRIGYVGYKTPEEARRAVKHFNRSFIRMSKIAVELAKPIADPSLASMRGPRSSTVPSSRSTVPSAQMSRDAKAEADSAENNKKRKREAVDESDPKLKEFLNVMQASGRSIHDIVPETLDERPAKVKAVTVPENDSDDEYENVPTKFKPVASRARAEAGATPLAAKPPAEESKAHAEADEAAGPAAAEDVDAEMPEAPEKAPAAAATDDDWLRSRTNRLLDLVDEDDEIPLRPTEPAQSAMPKVSAAQSLDAAEADATEAPDATNEVSPSEEMGTEDIAPVSKDDAMETVHKTARLFIRNLPYTATPEDLRTHFEQWGTIEEVHMPMDKTGSNNRGFAFVLFVDADAAVNAFQNAAAFFQGRLLHVLPSSAKRDHNLDEYELSKLPLKQQNLIKKKAKAATDRFNWNSLFMNQDAVVASVSARLGITKSELLDPHSSDAAVKQAIAETSTIQDTKAYFSANGVDLNAFKSGARGDTSILVKNFPYGTSVSELRTLFEEHGQVLKVLMPPAGTIAIVHFAQAPQAKSAFSKLAYRRFKNSILFLEKGPKNLFVGEGEEGSQEPAPAPASASDAPGSAGGSKLSVSELLGRETDEVKAETGTLFVKNLSFQTTTEQLAASCRHLEGFKSARVKTKTDPKKPGQILSMGFGFVEFSRKDLAEAALAVLNGHVLQGHKLEVKASHRGHDAAEERRQEDQARKAAGHRTKIVIKNLPFEANKKDIRTLFGTYGQLRSVRIPKKFNHASTRGFAFAEFTTPREAENAFNSLQDTHLLGRKLVLQFAEAEAVDAEEEIAKMQKKVGRQANKVALQQLTGGGRKKVTIGGDGDEDEGDM
ncbi:uncharacterized protein B0I36DRAFT_327733 [Microdochium trichocladiopsis]|uniref:Multiple RNA-binding domain-containing protein 1 n=1 Tax=Microdochium trichocladiopsis TaxID=1682393 RepID=A0A9P8Y245_9PEZI|nr:uncharacterized protein B0I36DRAFT_327733 [Microdochium trichocladiopsis]KAH7027721.1 hypothetical protein B0I36DRAFT_327733 [Microdochium trichocladiopsis]